MKTAPWFKMFASDFMMDRDIDELPLEAVGLLVKIWCVLWVEGSISPDHEEIARKCRVKHLHVQMHMQNLMQFLCEDASGLLISKRMEEERSKSSITSKARSQSAKSRWNKEVNAFAYASGNAKHNAKTMHSESESESDKNNKPPAAFIVPDWVPKKEWDDYEHMRKRIRRPMTLRAKELAVKTLSDFKGKGYSPESILNYSILNSYQGLFEPKQNGNHAKPDNAPKTLNAIAELDRRRAEKKAREAMEHRIEN